MPFPVELDVVGYSPVYLAGTGMGWCAGCSIGLGFVTLGPFHCA